MIITQGSLKLNNQDLFGIKKQEKWDRHWLRVAWMTAINLSKDPTTKVGAVIVTPDNRQMSTGYNGFPKGVDESPYKWERPLKYEYVVHSELNAIMNCPFDAKGCTIYITMTPCHRCLCHMINAGIKRIVYNEEYNRLTHKDICDELRSHFDEVIQIDDQMCDTIKSLL